MLPRRIPSNGPRRLSPGVFRLLRHVAASMAVSVPILLLALMPRASAEAHPAGAVTAARTSHALRGTFVPVTTGKLLFGAAALPRPTTVTVPKGLAQKVLTEAAAPGSGTADQLAPKPPTTSPYPHASVGFDISWPQCGSPLPGPQVVAPVGVNNGSAFTLNPCLSSEVAWAGSSLTLYTNLNSPTPHTDPSQWYSGPAGTCTELGCASWNYGYKSAQWAMRAARDAGASSKTWWLDVEKSNIWSPNTEANDDVVSGAIAAVRQAGAQPAVYATALQWQEIAGGWTPGVPVWFPIGNTPAPPASFCSPTSFAGGPVYMVQSLPGSPYDQDYTC